MDQQDAADRERAADARDVRALRRRQAVLAQDVAAAQQRPSSHDGEQMDQQLLGEQVHQDGSVRRSARSTRGQHSGRGDQDAEREARRSASTVARDRAREQLQGAASVGGHLLGGPQQAQEARLHAHQRWQQQQLEQLARQQQAAEMAALEAEWQRDDVAERLMLSTGLHEEGDAAYEAMLEEAERAERLRLHLAQCHAETLDRTCSICMDRLPYGGDGDTTITLSCHPSHAFCGHCIAGFWERDARHRCPLCNQHGDVSDVAAVAAAATRRRACEAARARAQQEDARQAAWEAFPAAAECVPLPPARDAPPQPLTGEWEAIDRFSVLTCTLSPLTHLLDVPSDLRVHWARARVDVFEFHQRACAAHDELQIERALKWHLCLHDVLLSGPRRGTRGSGREAGVVAARFERWRAGDRASLLAAWEADRVRGWQRASQMEARTRHRPASAREAEELEEARRAQTVATVLELVEDGELSRALRQLHSLGVAGISESVLAQLRGKHPPRGRPLPDDLPMAPRRVQVALTDTFRGLRRRAGTGPSGARNEYLRALVGHFDDQRADRVMSLFDEFASQVASAEMPSWFYTVQSFACLLPIVKEALSAAQVTAGVQPDVRPIAIGEVEMRALQGHVTQSVEPAMADVLAPQQVAVGVAGGVSILIHGVRVLVEYRGDFVIVKIDLRNAYNAASRSVLLRRFAEHPSLAPLMPLLHAALARADALAVGQGRGRLFPCAPNGRPTRADSAEGLHQGAPPSSGVFCVGIQPELEALDAELAPFGGGARAIMDDVYAFGPARVVFPAITRFATAVHASLGLEMQAAKSSCYSRAYDLASCPWRRWAGIPVGEEGGAPGIIVGGVPVGSDEYVEAVLAAEVDHLVSYIDTTVSQLRGDSPHAVWAFLYYCCSSRFDYWLRHLPPTDTVPHARRVDAAIEAAVEQLGYEGMLGDRATLQRARLPARHRGLGLRSREELAPAAFCACFVESAERLVDVVRGGTRLPGVFPMLSPLFGPGAFDGAYPQASRLSHYLSGQGWRGPSPTAVAFSAAWAGMQAEVQAGAVALGRRVAGPLDLTVGAAGDGRASSAGLQRLITAQREQVARDRLHRQIMQWPRGDTRREAWLACDAFSSAWVGSWPSQRDAISPQEFPEVLASYLGRESPAVRRLAGRMIPDVRAPRVCDPHGVQLGLAQLTDRAHGECHDGIAAAMFHDVLHAGVRGSTEPYHLFSGVLPPRQLERAEGERGGGGGCSIIPDAELHVRMTEARVERCRPEQRWRGTAAQRGPMQRYATRQLFDVKTVHGGGPDYMSARARGEDGQSGAVAQRAARVHRDYEAAARKLDGRHDVQAFNAGRADAVAAALGLYGQVRALVIGQYGEASTDVHELLDIVVERATRDSWRFLGARSQAEARSYFTSSMRRAWGVAFVREFARHRVSRLCFVGAVRRPGAQAVRAHAAGLLAAWPMRSPGEFWAHAVRASGAVSARRGWPRRGS